MSRVLVVCPSWVGDAVMATPALRLVRRELPGVFLGGLVRPGIDQVLDGLGLFDEVHVERASGVMGPKFVAAKLRPRRYDVALLLTNSFSTALVARIAGIPRRIGVSRDARGILLTDPLSPPPGSSGGGRVERPLSAVNYYWNLGEAVLEAMGRREPRVTGEFRVELPAEARMEIAATAAEREAAGALLGRAGVESTTRLAILNPGGNNAAKRWPADRFVEVGRVLARRGLVVLVNGSPAEAELTAAIARGCGGVDMAAIGGTLGSLKGLVCSGRAAIMVTNDTGPRHIAAAARVPVVSLFGPTDHRWTTIPVDAGLERVIVADPTLPENVVADDVPERCRVDRIEVGTVLAAVDGVLGTEIGAPRSA